MNPSEHIINISDSDFQFKNEYSVAEQLIPLAQAMADLENNASPMEENDDELRAYHHALR